MTKYKSEKGIIATHVSFFLFFDLSLIKKFVAHKSYNMSDK